MKSPEKFVDVKKTDGQKRAWGRKVNKAEEFIKEIEKKPSKKQKENQKSVLQCSVKRTKLRKKST